MSDIELKKSQQHKIFLFLSGILVVAGCSTTSTLNFDTSESTNNQANSTSTTSTSQTTGPTNTTGNTASSSGFENSQYKNEQTVRQQFQELVLWQDKCYQQPKSCRVEEFTIVGTKYHQALDEQISLYAKSNIYSRPGYGKRKVEIKIISFEGQSSLAQIDACIHDSVILYMDGFIFNDRVSSSQTRWTLQLVDSRWKWINFQILHREYNTNICQSNQ